MSQEERQRVFVLMQFRKEFDPIYAKLITPALTLAHKISTKSVAGICRAGPPSGSCQQPRAGSRTGPVFPSRRLRINLARRGGKKILTPASL